MSAVVLLLGAAIAATDDRDDSALALVDLPEYRAALEPGSGSGGPAVVVGFRDLWDHPDRYRGRQVRVEGRIVRRFHQGPVGTFPALTEIWINSPAGDPFCLVFPAVDPAEPPATGDTVRFTGTFLKRLQYPAGDTARLAPLLVGSRPPERLRASPPVPVRGPGFTPLDWGIGIAATAVVLLILARQFLGRPRRRRLRPEPSPEFRSSGDPTLDPSAEADVPGVDHDGPSER